MRASKERRRGAGERKKSRSLVSSGWGWLLILAAFWVLPLSPAGAQGSISGRVTGPDRSPVANLTVTAHNPCSNAQIGRSARTDSDGRYTLVDLEAEEYTVWARASGDLVGEWYRDALDFDTAARVTVQDGADTPGIDFTLARGGSISGRVTDKVGNPIPNLTVSARDFDNDTFRNSARTDAEGKYQIKGLPPGEHAVATQFGTDWMARYYGGGGSDSLSATPVKVVGTKDTPRIDFVLEQGGSISGQAVDADDESPISNLRVEVWRFDIRNLYSSGVFLGSTQTNAAGQYTIRGLPAGDHLVWARTPVSRNEYAYQFYAGSSDPLEAMRVSVTPGTETSGIDFSLGPGGSIKGTILDAQGQPVPCGRAMARNFETSAFQSTAVWAEPDGFYSIEGLPPGDQRVWAQSGGEHFTRFAFSYYNYTSNFAQARPVPVAAEEITKNIDFTLPRAGTISGRVTRQDGSLLRARLLMGVSDLDTLGSPGFSFRSWRSGRYTIPLSPGQYFVAAGGWPEGEERPFIRQVYKGVTQASQGTPVKVVEGQDTPGIDFAPRLADGTLSGRVTDEGGEGLRRFGISAFDSATGRAFSGAYLDLKGNYTVGLPAGSYRVLASTDWELSHHVSEFFPDTPDFRQATPVPVAAGADRPGIDFALQGGAGAIEGRITQAGSGEPLSFIPVAAIDPTTDAPFPALFTDGLGHYRIRLPLGRYRVQANPADTASHSHKPTYETRDNPTLVEVRADQVTPDINFSLSPVKGPDLTGAWEGPIIPSCKGSGEKLSCSMKGTFNLQNQGTEKALKKSTLIFYLSSDATFEGDRDLLLKRISVGALKAGQAQKKALSVKLRKGSNASGQYVVAVVDATDAVKETSETNNQIPFGPLP